MTKEEISLVLEKVGSWPQEDQEEIAEIAREIEARRSGVYVLSDDERCAIERSRNGPFASEDEVSAFWKRHGIGGEALAKTPPSTLISADRIITL